MQADYYADGQWNFRFCPKCKTEKSLDSFYLVRGRMYPYCKECKKSESKKYRHNNPQKALASTRKWHVANPTKQAEYSRHRRELNRDKAVAATRKSYRKHHKDRLASGREHYRNNKHLYNAKVALRKARKIQATPSWANHQYIDDMYLLSKIVAEATGVKYHVDHIVPLVSHLVCGLHVECNLQVVPATDNLSKHNKHWPEMP